MPAPKKIALFLGMVVGVACSPTSAPVESGSLQLFLLDHPASGAASAASPWDVRLAHHKNFRGNYFHGQLVGTLRVLLSTDGIRWVEALPRTGVAVDLQAPDRETALDASLPVGTYGHLRLLLEDTSVSLAPGSSIGGIELAAPRVLAIEEGTTVHAQLALPSPLEISAGTSATLSIDLNAEDWVTEDHLVAGSVPATEWVRALAVRIGHAAPRPSLRTL